MSWEIAELESEIESMMSDPNISFSCELDRQSLQMINADIKNIERKEMEARPLWFQIISQYVKPHSDHHLVNAWNIFNKFKLFAWREGDEAYNPQIETLNKFKMKLERS